MPPIKTVNVKLTIFSGVGLNGERNKSIALPFPGNVIQRKKGREKLKNFLHIERRKTAGGSDIEA